MKKSIFLMACLGLMAACNTAPTSQTTATECAGELLASNQDAVAETAYGQVAGFVDRGINVFKGIPYAKAERFMAPQAPDAWKGIRSSRQFGPTCPQEVRTGWKDDSQAFAYNWNDGYPGEDCLRVNIWTPGIDQGKRPVMVWLHGGGFYAGSGQELPSYDGLNLAKSGDVVVVTLNHRINALGFLDLSEFGEKYAQSGNVGMLDLIQALKWVKENIAGFGGDPANVTIFGQSGGGGKVSTLMAMPSAQGLFHKAIVESGSILTTMTQNYSRKIGALTVKALGLNANTIDKLAEVPFTDLLDAANKAITEVRKEAEADGFKPFLFGFAPIVDEDLIPYQPADVRALAWSKDIPVIVGSTGTEFTMSSYLPDANNISDELLKRFLARYEGDVDAFIAAIKEAYPNCEAKDLIDTDMVFRPMAVQQCQLRVANCNAPVYNYIFKWESPILDGKLRSNHCMEIPFVFNNATVHASFTGGGADAVALAAKVSKAWANFARTGNPNGEGVPEWTPFTDGEVLLWNNTSEMRKAHDATAVSIANAHPFKGF